jgi:hypothetical protein
MNTSWNHGYKGIAENGHAGSHLVPMILQWPPKKRGPKVEEVKNFRSIHTLWSLPDQGGDMCKVWFRSVQNVNLFKFHTNKQTNKHSSLYIRHTQYSAKAHLQADVFCWEYTLDHPVSLHLHSVPPK